MIHQLRHLSSSPNQFVPEIVSPLPCSSGLVHHILPFVCFLKDLISFIGFLDKYHPSVFNALILYVEVFECYTTSDWQKHPV